MGGKAPKQQPAPDPFAVAKAQTGSNVETAIANSYIGNANEVGPYGSVSYKKTGSHNVGGHEVPTWTRTTTLDPAQQRLLDQQNELGGALNDMAIGQSKRLAQHLSQPFSLDGLPEAPGDFEPYRAKVEAGMMERMNPQIERDRNALETKLINQGLVRGTTAFNDAMDEVNRGANDARTQIFLASGNEARAAGQFQGTTRERAIQERKLMRDQPINEITALMNGGQVSVPQFTPYQPGQVAGTPVGDYVYRSADLNARNADRAAQAAGNTWSTIGNIGAGLFRWSDARLKTDIEFVGHDGTFAWYRYRYIGSDVVQIGVLAQEVLAIRPEAVVLMPNGYYAVDYGAL